MADNKEHREDLVLSIEVKRISDGELSIDMNVNGIMVSEIIPALIDCFDQLDYYVMPIPKADALKMGLIPINSLF